MHMPMFSLGLTFETNWVGGLSLISTIPERDPNYYTTYKTFLKKMTDAKFTNKKECSNNHRMLCLLELVNSTISTYLSSQLRMNWHHIYTEND